MNYKELLQDLRWKNKSKDIKERDENCCQNCQNKKPLLKFEISEVSIRKSKNGVIFTTAVVNDKKYQKKITKPYLKVSFSDVTSKLITKNENMKRLGLIEYDTETNFFNLIGFFFINKEYYDFQPTRKSSGFNFINTEEQVIEILERESYHRKIKKNISNELLKKIKWIELKVLHTHHKYYQKGKKPWEYPDEALITLCWSCHEELHKNKVVPVYDEYMNRIDQLNPCGRCHGAGIFPEYSHVQGGICFECDGAKYIELINNSKI